MLKISTEELFNLAGIDVKNIDRKRQKVRFLRYIIDRRTVNVQFTAAEFIDAMTTMSADDQEKLFAAILLKLPKPGDFCVIQEGEVNMFRTAIITRLTSKDEMVVNLLLTY